jgi:hypothetical protein
MVDSILKHVASAQAATSSMFKGPTDGDYETADSIPFSSTIWSPCGAALPLNINSQVILKSTVTTATGLMTEDSVDGKVTFQVGVRKSSRARHILQTGSQNMILGPISRLFGDQISLKRPRIHANFSSTEWQTC